MRCIVVVIVAAILSLAPVPALAEDAQPIIRAFDQKTLVLLGRYIYREDQFAWKASDILSARISPDQARNEHLSGSWITHLSTVTNVVRFLREGDHGPEAAYDVTFDGDGSGSLSEPKDRALTTDELAQFKARKLALENITRPCSNRYNTVAMADIDGNWLVWALAATTVPGEIVYGGHYRFTISKDGTSIIHRDALSRACMRIPPPDTSKGKPVAVYAVQLVSKIPVETTVWLSLQHKTLFIIGTGENENWAVTEGTMSPLKN